MSDTNNDIISVLERLLLKKNDCGEYIEIGDERLILTREECPSVLLAINKHNSDIILVQQYTQHSKRKLSSSKGSSTRNGVSSSHTNASPKVFKFNTPAKRRTSSDDLDVTGSPLKCSFMQNFSNEDLSPFTVFLPTNKKKAEGVFTYSPIASAKSGLITSKLNLALKKLAADIKDFVPLWVICDAQDNQGTVFVGVHRDDSGLTRSIVRSGGPYELDHLPTLDQLIIHHTAVGAVKTVDSVVEAVYNVQNCEDEDKESSLSLRCRWKRPLTVLSPPDPDAFTTACVRVVCGDGRSAAYQLYLELMVLKGFVAGVRSGEVAWHVHQNSNTVAESLKEVFSTIKDKGQRQKKDEDGGNNLDLMIEGKFFNQRQNMEFTDHLWTILMRCESYQELKDSLRLVFKAVESEEIRPQIHVRNTTQVGLLLRNIMRGKDSVPELSGVTPLQMLIEMGIEKIKRDYINIFQNGDLATFEQLSWFVVNDDDKEKQDDNIMLKQLGRLHIALEVIVALRTYLNLPVPQLAHLTAKVLNLIKDEEPGMIHSYFLKLETSSVHELLHSLKASCWEVKLSSELDSFSKSLVCHVSHTPLIQLQNSHDEDGEDEIENKEDGNEKEHQYYCTYFINITDQLFVL